MTPATPDDPHAAPSHDEMPALDTHDAHGTMQRDAMAHEMGHGAGMDMQDGP